MSVDSRTVLRRVDAAAADLEGRAPAPRYVDPDARRVILGRAPIRRAPAADAEQVDELVHGEELRVLSADADWAFGQASRDGYVGFVPTAALGPGGGRVTHTLAAPVGLVLEAPDLRAPVRTALFMNALVGAVGEEGRFTRLSCGGFLPTSHLRSVGAFAADPVEEAERFLGAPYHWGGRTALGIDCSGLVQQALYACGRACPRDSDQQQGLGAAPPSGLSLKGLRRADLVFWRGHVGMMADADVLLHANAHHMAVAAEPVAAAAARIEAGGGGPVTAVRRI